MFHIDQVNMPIIYIFVLKNFIHVFNKPIWKPNQIGVGSYDHTVNVKSNKEKISNANVKSPMANVL